MRSQLATPERFHLALAALDAKQQGSPGFERRAALLEVVVAVIGTLDTAQLVTQAAFGHFAPYAKRREVRACRAAEIVEREVRHAVLHALQGHVQGVDAHVRYPLPGSRRRFGKT